MTPRRLDQRSNIHTAGLAIGAAAMGSYTIAAAAPLIWLGTYWIMYRGLGVAMLAAVLALAFFAYAEHTTESENSR